MIDLDFTEINKKIKELIIPSTERLEIGFSAMFPDGWKKLSESDKQSIIKEFQDFTSLPQNKMAMKDTAEEIKYIKNLRSDIKILFLGVALGVVGNLIANWTDRMFREIGGILYDDAVWAIFLILIFFVHHIYIKKPQKDAMEKEAAQTILGIFKKYNLE